MGFIKIDRKMLEWEWHTDSSMMAVWIHCLLKANWKDGRFKGMTVKRGSFITSIRHMADETGCTPVTIRRCLSKLESSGEITRKVTHRYTVINVVKYADYQDVSDESNTVSNTVSSTVSSTVCIHNRRSKEVKNKRSNTKDIQKSSYGSTFGNVKLTEKQFDKLHADYPEYADEAIEYLDKYIAEKHYKSYDHNLAIRRWVIDAVSKNKRTYSNKTSQKIELPEYMKKQKETGIQGSSEKATPEQINAALEIQRKMKERNNRK